MPPKFDKHAFSLHVVAGLVLAAMLVSSSILVHSESGLVETGFFTTEFGRLEMLALYGPMVINLLPPIVRMLTGRRNPARLFEALTAVCLATGSLWLLTVFPFEFSHLADILPAGLQFTIGWISNGFARVILIFQVVLGPISLIANLAKFVSVRKKEFAALISQQPT